MRIGINLVGVSYNDGTIGRYRNYEDALEGFMTNVVNSLKEEGHDIFFYLFTYDSPKKEDILRTYTPIKSTFLDPNYNKMGGGDVIENQMKIISLTYINALNELIGEDLDLIISTRFDISFNINPFKEFNFEFDKFNFFIVGLFIRSILSISVEETNLHQDELAFRYVICSGVLKFWS